MRIKFFLPGIIWFFTSFILLALPGDDLPDTGFFNIPYFDKWVHFGMFFLLTFLFCYPFSRHYKILSLWKEVSYKIALTSIVYGILMEYVQKYFVNGRSFDLTDILFDALGSFGGLIGSWKYFAYKKIGPDRNRGRNQN